MGGFYTYLTRVIPAVSILVLVALLAQAFSIPASLGLFSSKRNGEATAWQAVLAAYAVFLHVLAIGFPARLCWAMIDITQKIKDSSADHLQSKQVMKEGRATKVTAKPIFVIIIPAYDEELSTLEETLSVLASHARARSAYHVYLAMEKKEKKAADKAAGLIHTFQRRFHKMSYTLHPHNIPGEAQGKSSNESWAARHAYAEYAEEVKKDVIITVMDADTHLSTRYFAQVENWHLTTPSDNQDVMYVPPIVFDRNLHTVPLPVRTADIMWAGAGLSSLKTGSSVCIPTSVYSVPMTLAQKVGSWDTGPEAIGEDMHMYLKCFFHLYGHLKVRIIYAAASQCDVSSDCKGFYGYLDTLKARYRQAVRHMWGSLGSGYAARQIVALIARSHGFGGVAAEQSPLKRNYKPCAKQSDLTVLHTVHECPETIHNHELVDQVYQKSLPPRRIHKENVFVIFVRLFEAHFLPLHLALVLVSSGIYELTSTAPITDTLATALYLCSWLRLGGWALVVVYLQFYKQYHRLCVRLRKEEMQEAGLYKHVSHQDNGFSSEAFARYGVLEALLFPISGVLFGALPACQAIFSHVFTDRLTYHVSLKPVFMRHCQDVRKTPSQQTVPQQRAMLVQPRYQTWKKDLLARFSNAVATSSFDRSVTPVKRKD